MGLAEGPVGCKEKSTFQVREPISLYPRVRVQGDGRRVVSQAGAVLLVEYRPDRPTPYRARVRWTDPTSKRRESLSEGKDSEEEAQEWLQAIIEAAEAGLSPSQATMKLAEYGEANMDLALRGLELKTLDPYLSGWRMRVVPALGHLAVRMITNGVVDRTVQNWIADEHSRSTVKNTIAVLVRVMEQAVRDGIIKVNPAG